MSSAQIRDSLATLTGNERLDASAIKNLPTGSSSSLVIASSNGFQTTSGDHLLASNFTANLPLNPVDLDHIFVHTAKNPQVLNTNQTNVSGQVNGIVSMTLSVLPHPILVYFQNGVWNTANQSISGITIDPNSGVALTSFTSHEAPSGLFDYLGRNNGQSSTYTNPIDGTRIAVTASSNIGGAPRIADRSISYANLIGAWHGGNSAPEWIQIELLGNRSFSLKQLSIRAVDSVYTCPRFTVSGSMDGVNFTNIWNSGVNVSPNTNLLSPNNLSNAFYRFFKFTEDPINPNEFFVIGEMELYGILT